MIPFDEVVFPELLLPGYSGGPNYPVTTLRRRNGTQIRIANRRTGLHRYNIAPLIKSEQMLQDVISFFVARNGSSRAFRFKDWFDYTTNTNDVWINPSVAITNAKGIVLAESGEHRLYKTYSDGSFTKYRRITKPRAADYSGPGTLNATTGKTTADGAWAGTFDVPVRFDPAADDLQSITWGSFRNGQISITLLEVPIYDLAPSWQTTTPVYPIDMTASTITGTAPPASCVPPVSIPPTDCSELLARYGPGATPKMRIKILEMPTPTFDNMVSWPYTSDWSAGGEYELTYYPSGFGGLMYALWGKKFPNDTSPTNYIVMTCHDSNVLTISALPVEPGNINGSTNDQGGPGASPVTIAWDADFLLQFQNFGMYGTGPSYSGFKMKVKLIFP